MKINCPHCRQSIDAADELAASAAACPACKGLFEVPQPPAFTPRLSCPPTAGRTTRACDPAFRSACRFLCGILRVEFGFGCLALLGALLMLAAEPAAGMIMLIFLAGILGLIRVGIKSLTKARGVTGWSVAFLIFGLISGLGHLMMFSESAAMPGSMVVGCIVGIILDFCLVTGSVATLVAWHGASGTGSAADRFPAPAGHAGSHA